MAAAATGRAAKCSADRVRSTPWSSCAASATTSTTGRPPAIPAGDGTTCCPISSPSRPSKERIAPSAAGGGPLDVIDMTGQRASAVRDLSDAAEQAGYPRTPDYNGARQEGVAVYQITTSTACALPRRRRSWPGDAAQEPHGPDRRIRDAHPFREGAGRRRRVCRSGQTMTVRANRECIVSAGAVNSPALLQHSGIGPGALLQSSAYLSSTICPLSASICRTIWASTISSGRGNRRSTAICAVWMGGRGSACATWLFATARCRSASTRRAVSCERDPSLDAVDMQLYFSPVSYSKPTPGARRLTLPDPFPGFFIGISPCRPKSRGSDPYRLPRSIRPPVIAPNYLSEPKTCRACSLACG